MTTVKEEAVSIWWERYIPKDQLIHLVAGGVAGGVSRTCVSPLERVKMLLQVRKILLVFFFERLEGTRTIWLRDLCCV